MLTLNITVPLTINVTFVREWHDMQQTRVLICIWLYAGRVSLAFLEVNLCAGIICKQGRKTDISHESLCSLLVSFLLIFTLAAAPSQWTTFSRESNTGTCKLINFYSPDKATAVCGVYEGACVHGPKKNQIWVQIWQWRRHETFLSVLWGQIVSGQASIHVFKSVYFIILYYFAGCIGRNAI